MIIIYLIPSGAYLVSFLIGLMVLDSIADAMSTIETIFILLTMLFPVLTSSAAIFDNYTTETRGISKQRVIAMIIVTLTTVISTVKLFDMLKSADMSIDGGLNRIFQSLGYMSDMGFCLFKILIVCSIYGSLTIEGEQPPLLIAVYNIGITALCMHFVSVMFESL